MTKRVLFVCTGNICRSPAAEAVLRQFAEQKSLDLETDSAGTHGYHVGDAPDPRGVQIGDERGYELHSLRARKVRTQDFNDFDLILAMDRGHLEILSTLQPNESRAKLALFMQECVGRERFDIPDPYYGDFSDFEHMYDLIEEGLHGLCSKLSEKNE